MTQVNESVPVAVKQSGPLVLLRLDDDIDRATGAKTPKSSALEVLNLSSDLAFVDAVLLERQGGVVRLAESLFIDPRERLTVLRDADDALVKELAENLGMRRFMVLGHIYELVIHARTPAGRQELRVRLAWGNREPGQPALTLMDVPPVPAHTTVDWAW